MRLKDRNTVEILIDPWGDNSAIWELNIINMEFKMKSAFNKYKDKPYTENVEW
jgi:hypothetical protein